MEQIILMKQRRCGKAARQARKAVKFRGVKPLHFRQPTAEDMTMSAEAASNSCAGPA